MTAERWTRAVRQQVGLGRLLPLGGPRDGAWITEAAAGAVLRRAAEVPGVRVDALRIGLADPEDVREPVVPPPPGALPPGPLRVTADFAATAGEPLPTTAARLRSALMTAATERLGLVVGEVDLRVTELLDEDPEPGRPAPPRPPRAGEPTDPAESRAGAAALSVPGTTHLTRTLGKPVRIEERPDGAALSQRHARVELAVDTGHRTVDVARQVRTAVRDALPARPTVTVLVTGVS